MVDFTIEKKSEGQYNLFMPRNKYVGCASYGEWKITRRHIGHFFFKDGRLYFQYAGKGFRMSGTKVYEPALKEIDLANGTMKAVNTDRNGRVVKLGYYREFVDAVLKMAIDDGINQMLIS
jgi:hypothetical protein